MIELESKSIEITSLLSKKEFSFIFIDITSGITCIPSDGRQA